MSLAEAVGYALSEPNADAIADRGSGRTSADRPRELTWREQEVAALVARGLTNRRIAAELHISEHTAATHVRRILRKLGLRSRSELAAWIAEREARPAGPTQASSPGLAATTQDLSVVHHWYTTGDETGGSTGQLGEEN